ncbi:MAG: hypothetical protein JWO02_4568 [Solirubrobacterales bacterium]|nr:hypothetical protein [Solirubrobacterales bacterium]
MENPKPILIVVLAFILLFAALTLSVIVREGLDILTVISIVILGMFGFGVVGALRQPPE